MSYQEFIIGFETLISGFAAARFFQGWGEMVKFSRKFRFYWAHILLSIVVFFILIQQWWHSFHRDPDMITHIWDFTFMLTIPALFYFMSVQFFPIFKGHPIDLKDYFYRNKHLFAIYIFLYFCILTLRYIYYDLPLWDDRGLTRIAGMTMSVIMYFTRLRWVAELLIVIAAIFVFWFFSYVEPMPQ